MTHDEMIAVIQAHKDGKKIQCRSNKDSLWHEARNPVWDFCSCQYRVKPEPRVRYFASWTNPDGTIVIGVFGFDSESELLRSCNINCRPIKFIEVLEDA